MALGLTVAAFLSSVLRGMLFGIPTLDVLTYVGVAIAFLGVALLASWGPAQEATRIDPREALRAE